MLHLIHQSPFQSNSLQRCLQVALAGDFILLMQEAVLAVLNSDAFIQQNPGLYFYCLENDILAHGLQDKITADLKIINYDQFVELTVSQQKILSWA